MRKFLPVLLALPLFAGQAFGWGCDGHQMLAQIARNHLTPAASAAVDKLFAESPLAPAHRRFCQDQPTDLMVDAAPWADDIKSSDKTFLWHQIDIPLMAERGDYRKWCDPIGPSVDGKDRPGCVINALEYELAILRDKQQPAPDRAKALRMIIHLIGDLTQPLHISDNRDEGGNCTSFELSYLPQPTNLHGLWDYELITHELQQKKVTEMQLAETIDSEYKARFAEWGTGKIDIEGWAWEAHALARTRIYGPLQPRIPVEPEQTGYTTRAACDAERAKVAALKIPITQAYQDAAIQLIHQQLAVAGYRLADVLNQVLQ